jgi:hypothetical protein
VEVPGNNDHRDDQTTKDHTEDILEWAKRKISAVSESKPFRMAPIDHSMIEAKPEPPAPEPELPASESEPKTVEPKTVEPETVQGEMVEGVEVSTVKMATRLFVVELDEANANQGRIHLMADEQEAGRFIEDLLDKGLAPDRLAALRGTRMSVNVRYRVEAIIEHLTHE